MWNSVIQSWSVQWITRPLDTDLTSCWVNIRWSSDKQSGGSTLARQLKRASDIAHDNQLVGMIDTGISAFRSKNASTAELGITVVTGIYLMDLSKQAFIKYY